MKKEPEKGLWGGFRVRERGKAKIGDCKKKKLKITAKREGENPQKTLVGGRSGKKTTSRKI